MISFGLQVTQLCPNWKKMKLQSITNVNVGIFSKTVRVWQLLTHINLSISSLFIICSNIYNSHHNAQYNPHRGQPPCHGGGAQHRWPERFLKSGGKERLSADQIRVGILLHDTSSFVLVSASQLTTAYSRLLTALQRLFTALQPSIYGFTAVTAAATCNLLVTFGYAHWAELIRPQRWAGVRACPPQR